ncbi:uncharacterized N-acetyltransferase p20-like [Macadamia integrifolia]|uniref:uncharacterized N-acetyltransferase p20-like n=1 Tax=Macadamia integrifolia TaxID=60698 RepID=UPI001C4FCA03|nr:uncharacterized N-acetyltransferase p20-like [Macadamia integrifolia]
MEGSSIPNISLRPIELSDLDDFMVWATDDLVTRFCSWESYTSREAALAYLKEKVIPHPWYRVICLENRPVGAISVIPGSGNDNCRGELGYVLASKYWGKGIATRAVKLVVSSIFEEWPHLVRLEALVDVENPGSQRVLEKVGFQKEGVLRKYLIQKGSIRDMVMYSLLSLEAKLVE